MLVFSLTSAPDLPRGRRSGRPRDASHRVPGNRAVVTAVAAAAAALALTSPCKAGALFCVVLGSLAWGVYWMGMPHTPHPPVPRAVLWSVK